jgi:hypothetical protein
MFFELNQVTNDEENNDSLKLGGNFIWKENGTEKENQPTYTLDKKKQFGDPNSINASNFWKEWKPEDDNVEGTTRKHFSSWLYDAFGSSIEESDYKFEINELLKQDLATWRKQQTKPPHGKVFNFVDDISGEKGALVVSEVTGKWSIFLKEEEKVRARHGYVSIEDNAITHTTWEDAQSVICPEGHELEDVEIVKDDRACDECGNDRTDFNQADEWKCYRCHKCEPEGEPYDLCAECFESKKVPGQVLVTTINSDLSVIKAIKEFKVKTKIVTSNIRKAAYFEAEHFLGYYLIKHCKKSVKFDGSTTKYRVQWKDGSKENTLKNENELLVDGLLEVKDTVVTENDENLGEIVEILENEKKQKSYKVCLKNSGACSTYTEGELRLYEKNEVAKPHERQRVKADKVDSKIKDKKDYGKNYYYRITSAMAESYNNKCIVKEVGAKTFTESFVLAREKSRRPNEAENEEKQNDLKRKREKAETESTASQDSKSTKASTTDGKSSPKPNELIDVEELSGLTRRSQRKIVKPARYEEPASTEAEKKRKV